MTISAQFVNSNTCATDAVSITPDDNNDLTKPVRALFINTTGGTVAVITMNGTSITLNLEQGQLFPLAVSRVKSAGTTAVGIIGLI